MFSHSFCQLSVYRLTGEPVNRGRSTLPPAGSSPRPLPVMFHQSGGCCDNSAANCYLPGEITIGAGDVLLGEIGGCPFYIGKSQYEYWKHTQLIIDVIEGHGGTFSLEGSEGKAFHTRGLIRALD
jgi:uncharacterized protein (DUF779 family)